MFKMFSTIFEAIAIWFIGINHLGKGFASACETISNTAETHNLQEKVKSQAALISLRKELNIVDPAALPSTTTKP